MTVDEGAVQTSGNGSSGPPQEAALNERGKSLSKMFLVYYQTVGWNKLDENFSCKNTLDLTAAGDLALPGFIYRETLPPFYVPTMN